MGAWIGVDLDGTLAEHHGQMNGIGDPIPSMVNRVKRWLEQGREVRIMTARAGDSQQIPIIRAWLKKNGLDGLTITNKKDNAMAQLWDDKARRVERNTGRVCKGCSSARNASQNHHEPILTDC